MARIVCQVLQRPQRLTFLWSQGEASFEPYHLEGSARDQFLQVARQIHERLPSADGIELAQLGHQFYRALFRLDDGVATAQAVQSWFTNLAHENGITELEFLSDEPGLFPWNALIDEVPAAESLQPGGEGWPRFFGARFSMSAGRRVNALRQTAIVADTTQLFAADPGLIERLSEAQQILLNPYRAADTLHYSLEALNGELKKIVPDIVLLLARFENQRLFLGAEALDLDALHAAFQDSQDANPEPLVIIMACGDVGAQSAWQAYLRRLTSVYGGLIANEVLLPAEPALALGTSVVTHFAQKTLSIGEAVRAARAGHGSAGLSLSAFCPPQLRVYQEGDTDTTATGVLQPLPDVPYFPFAAYEAADRPLFYGRFEETLACASLLDDARLRGVFLHGGAAVGKTSFLQAGLIPYLELDSVGYRVLRDRTPLETSVPDDAYPILILRCTNDLAGQFADALTVFCAQPLTYVTPLGSLVTVDLPALLQQAVTGQARGSEPSTAVTAEQEVTGLSVTAESTEDDEPEPLAASELWIALRDQPGLLARLLDELTRSLPFELVIVIDQGEELLTLVRSDQGAARRQKALEMLFGPHGMAARCKVIFMLQSNHLGRLTSLLPEGQMPEGWRGYYLPPLNEQKMMEALLWPTSREAIPYSDEVPFDKYGFTFEEGLAQKVVTEAALVASEQQSPLAILQALGALLYEQQVVGKHETILRSSDVKDLGGTKQALTKYLDAKLKRLGLNKQDQKALRGLIGKLFTSDADGTLSRDLVRANQLGTLWQGSAAPVEEVVNQAAEQEGLFEIQQLLIGGKQEVYVSLPQDSLAQLGKKLTADQALQVYARGRVGDMLWIMIPLVFFAAAFTYWATGNRNAARSTENAETAREQKANLDRAKEIGELRSKLAARTPLYQGLLAQAELALQAGNALRARQLLLSQPAQRSYEDDKEKAQLPDVRGFEWRYLWKYLNGEKHLFERHRSLVTSVAVSPDSRLVASASHDGMIYLWNLKTGEIVAALGNEKNPVISAIHAVAFSPDGKTLASAGADKAVRLWDIARLKGDYVTIAAETKFLQGHTGAVQALAFGKDSSTLASGDADKGVILWNLTQDKIKHHLKEHAGSVHTLAFSEDGKTLVSGGTEGQLIVWDAEAGTKRQALKTPYSTIAALAFSPDGKTLASGGTDTKLDAELGVVRFWDIAGGKETGQSLTYTSGVFTLAYHPDGKALAVGGKDSVVRLFDPANGNELKQWLGHLGWVRSLAFANDGSTLVTGSYDQTVKAWNPAQSSGPDVVQAHADWVQCLALDRKNEWLASGARDGTVKLWSTANAQMLLQLPLHQGSVTSLAFSSHRDKNYLAVGTRDSKNDGAIKIWQIDLDPKEGYRPKEKQTLKSKGVTSLAFHPQPAQAELLLSGHVDARVVLWDTNSGKEKETHQDHKDEVRCVAFAPEGKVYGSGGKDRLVCLYETGKEGHSALSDIHLGSIESLVLCNFPMSTEEGIELVPSLLTASTDQTLRLGFYFKTELGKLTRKEFRVYRSHAQPLSQVAFQEGKMGLIATSSWDRTIKLYDLINERYTLLGHSAAVRALAIAADQSFIASAGNDGTIRFWRAFQERPRTVVGEK